MTKVLGHRGGRGEGWPTENTLEAFTRAIDEGADGVELDARLTSDGVAIVLHDTTFARATGGADSRAVHEVPFGDLPALPGGERIPRLADALDVLRGRVVNVEVKADVAPVSMLGELPERLRLVHAAAVAVKRSKCSEVVLSSFDPLCVMALGAVLPRAQRAILVGRRTPRAATALPLAMRPLIVAAHLDDPLITQTRVLRLTRAGLRVAAWTVNDPQRAQALAALGVEWIISDVPGPIVSALRGRGAAAAEPAAPQAVSPRS